MTTSIGVDYQQGERWNWSSRLATTFAESPGILQTVPPPTEATPALPRAEQRRERRAARKRSAPQPADPGEFTLEVSIGGVDVSDAIEEARFEMKMNESPTIDLTLVRSLLPNAPLDYSAEVAIWRPPGLRDLVVALQVSAARGDDKFLHISGRTLEHMEHQTVSRAWFVGLWPIEMLYIMARTGGMREDQIDIPEIHSVAPEQFEVIVPLRGVKIMSRTSAGGTTLLPASEVRGLLPRSTRALPRYMIEQFLQFGAYVVATPSHRSGWEAEQAALADARLAAAWLLAESRFSLAVDQSGEPLHYTWKQNQAMPRIADLSFVRATRSGRGWIRETTPNPDPPDFVPAVVSEQVDLETKAQALLALHRAATTDDLFAANLALWDCIEFLVADVKLPALFTKQERQHALDSLSEHYTAEQLQRLEQVILGSLNSPPLVRRLEEYLRVNDVPYTTEEWNTIRSLRSSRNKGSTHGGTATAPRAEDLRTGVSVLARALRA